jgi:hypothetical protein
MVTKAPLGGAPDLWKEAVHICGKERPQGRAGGFCLHGITSELVSPSQRTSAPLMFRTRQNPRKSTCQHIAPAGKFGRISQEKSKMSGDPDSFFNERMGSFCKEMQDQIEGLPFLPQHRKDQFKSMLDDCAQKAKESDQDTVVHFNSSIPRVIKHVEFFGQTKVPQTRVV